MSVPMGGCQISSGCAKTVRLLRKAFPRECRGETKIEHVGAPVLDRIQQSMTLFATGRGEALTRFLAEDGACQDQRFWLLAQTLSALSPSHTEEKRWLDGMRARMNLETRSVSLSWKMEHCDGTK